MRLGHYRILAGLEYRGGEGRIGNQDSRNIESRVIFIVARGGLFSIGEVEIAVSYRAKSSQAQGWWKSDHRPILLLGGGAFV